MKKPELLAPAGNFRALNAAVRAGADAVYLGIQGFNARQSADNFTLDTLKNACEYCHLRGVKVYLTLNTLVITKELQSFLEIASKAYKCGVDAFIVQDIGAANIIAREFGSEFLHISTQMNLHNEKGIETANFLGAKRVTLSRELSLNEIKNIADFAHDKNMEVECFVHGAICICYSGQCLMSSMIGTRSANRGACSQCCRLPYTLISGENKREVAKNKGLHLLSPADMCTIDRMYDLISSGTDSFKIEGRAKSAEYVFATVKAYREVIDACVDCQPEVSDVQRSALQGTFSRGFTNCYLDNKSGMDLMSINRPNNRGIFAGRIKSSSKREIELKCDIKLCAGDTINIWTKHGGVSHKLTENEIVSSKRVLIKSTKEFKDVRASDRFFRLRAAEDEFIEDKFLPKVPMSAKIRMKIGSPFEIEVRANEFKSCVKGELVEQARSKVVEKDEVIAHFDRLGNSDFYLKTIEVDLDDGVGIGFSSIHKLRNEACNSLKDKMLGEILSRENINVTFPKAKACENKANEKKICVLATNPENARVAKKAGVDTIYVPLEFYKRGQAIYGGAKAVDASQTSYPNNIAIKVPQVNRENDFWFSDLDKSSKVLMCDDIASALDAKASGREIEIGQMIPIVNDADIEFANALEPNCVWLDAELNLAQIKDIAPKIDSEVGIFVYGRQKLMHCEHCLLSIDEKCDEICATCKRRCAKHWLRDRMDVDFPFVVDAQGRVSIYNSVALDHSMHTDELLTAGVNRFLIDSIFLGRDELLSIIDRIKTSFINPPKKRLPNTTSGHLFRGI